MPKHTPGPWRVRKGPYGSLQVGPAELRHPGKEAVALAEHYSRPDPLAQRAADAALIAAAPDMLTALQAALALLESETVISADSGWEEAAAMVDTSNAIRAAIALATTPAA